MSNKTRTLGFWVAFSMGLGTMIAAGIFSLSGTAVAAVGSSAVISFVIAALVAGITAAAYSEFAGIYSESGGGYLFISRTFENKYLVYIEGTMLFLGYSATTAFYLATMGEWVHEFIFAAPPWVVASGTALLLGALNARGTEESGSFQLIVTAAKVAVLLVFIGGAFLYKPPTESFTTFATSFSTDLPGILKIASMAFITFFGFSAIAASAGEIIEPQKTVPKAIAASIVTVTILYTLVIVAMVNSPVPAEVVAEQGETAMGMVANAFLGPVGMKLIIAGAIFSMVSASNASILAASRIGYLMGREGNAFRRFQRIHPKYGTPHWGIGACIFTIIALIVVFTGIFGHNSSLGIELGLSGLTGFANTNLLIPLSVVNVALIYSRRNEDIERPFKVPLSPVLPSIAIAANIALLASLPLDGVASGVLGIIGFAVVYALWGGAESMEELMEKTEEAETDESVFDEDEYQILAPVASGENVSDTLHYTNALNDALDMDLGLRFITIKQVPEQTPSDVIDKSDLHQQVEEIRDEVSDFNPSFDTSVEGYTTQDMSITVLQIAQEQESDLILMGYPEEHHLMVDKVQHKAPCNVAYTFGVDESTDFGTVTIGAGGGPNHESAVAFAREFGKSGSDVALVNVTPETGGTGESIDETTSEFDSVESFEVINMESENVATGLTDVVKERGGVLFIGSSRDSILSQWLFGSTPDRVIDIAEESDLDVVIYSSQKSVTGKLSDAVFVVYRFGRSVFGGK